MRLVIGADFAGYPLKEVIKEHLIKSGYEVVDLGATEKDTDLPYYKVATAVAKKVQSKEVDKALLFCGTGAGMCIVANKFKGVYAVACEGIFTARQCGIINNANILTLGSRVVGSMNAIEMVENWLSVKFLEGKTPENQKFLTNALEEVEKIETGNFK
ncbi:MAG TPA: RpiB/LacA/LacB family sugar-phosphate isomerase [Firmicutes bacterium]|jgi:ribose 5-phosphate isomerase B|nr:RpiB/LacA/LacB family sugar-phosphate isomerase [Bacillota bacterium]